MKLKLSIKRLLSRRIFSINKEVENLKSQYEYLLQKKEQEFEKFVNEFKQYHAQK